MMAALVALCLLAALPVAPASAGGRVGPGIGKVVVMIEDFKQTVEEEAKTEQVEYDKFACWCEDSLSTKAKEISQLKAAIQELQHTIIKLRGMLGSSGAEVEELTEGIAANVESTKEAKALREKEAEAYKARKLELEQYIGALEAAINALSGASSSATLLATVQEAQLLSTVGLLGDVLADARVLKMVSPKELEAVREFVRQPSRFIRAGGQRSAASFLETQASQAKPFGDYSSKTGQVQGVLKAMYDAFALELEKANAEEGSKIEPFEELLALKAEELASFQSQVGTLNSEHGDESQGLATATRQLDAARTALGKAEAFFGDASAGCREKAAAWAARTTLRSGELEAIQKALDILQSPEAQALFSSGAESFLQLGAPRRVLLGPRRPRSKALIVRDHAYEQLAKLAKQYGTLSLANIVAEVRFSSGGHFDKVVDLIDKLVAKLEQDGKDDVEKKEYCASETEKNEESKKDLQKIMKKTNKTIAIRKDRVDELNSEIAALDDKMNSTKVELAQLSDARAAETAEHERGLLQGMFAIKALKFAKAAISQFYKDNGYIELQTGASAPASAPSPSVAIILPAAVTVKDAAPLPTTSFDKGGAGGNAGGAQGIVQVLETIVTSIESDMKLSKTMEASSMHQFLLMREQMVALIDADKGLRDAKHKDLVVQDAKQAYELSDLQQGLIDKGSVEEILAALAEQCAWVGTHFESRAAKRQAEIGGLKQAKLILIGAAEHPQYK